jgi:cation diffusion facilitator CzcD-associated flavoprotein CzcO
MRTNTSKITTRFSDLPHADQVPMFPTHQQMHAYLRQYAEHFDLHRYVRLHSRVDMVQQGEDGSHACWHGTTGTRPLTASPAPAGTPTALPGL